MVFGEAQAEPGEPVARGCIVAAVQRDMMDRAAATRSHRGLLVIARQGEACGTHMDRGMAVAVQHPYAVADAGQAGRRRERPLLHIPKTPEGCGKIRREEVTVGESEE